MDLLVSEPRMDTYREAAVRACPSLGKAPIELLSESEGELEFHRKLEIAAARLYFWDSFVSGALWPWISFVEVIVRNSINDHLCAYFDVSPADGWHTLVRDGENFVKDSKEGDFLKTRYLLLTSRDYEAFKTKLNELDNLIEIAGYVDSDAAQLISEKNMVEVALSKKSEFLHGGTIL